ncbi:hypothetical protein BpHYR1_031333 [Brachionus plicatilis]|uniref:Uncharacterized protein n=1 Tax=Brachionus plicatilis TaxID=10195 RepID=A0A3M7QRY0_BRAPC|nr:hypothetical protein BpHYR1_031333 [Brachionus plicatilis]
MSKNKHANFIHALNLKSILKFTTLVLSEFYIFDSKFVIHAHENSTKNFFYTQGSKNSKPFKNIYILKEHKILYMLIKKLPKYK